MAKIPSSQCRGLGFDPGQGTRSHMLQLRHSQMNTNLKKCINRPPSLVPQTQNVSVPETAHTGYAWVLPSLDAPCSQGDPLFYRRDPPTPSSSLVASPKNPAWRVEIQNFSVLCLVTQLCLTLGDLMDYSPPGSSIHGDSPGKNTGVG